jgi:hypothetical protein
VPESLEPLEPIDPLEPIELLPVLLFVLLSAEPELLVPDEPLTGPEGDVIPPAVLPVFAPPVELLGEAASPVLAPLPAIGAVLVEPDPPAPASWAKAAGTNAATERARPAPTK